MATLQNPAKYNGLKEAHGSYFFSASPRAGTSKLSGLSGATTSTSSGALSMSIIKNYYDNITKTLVTGNFSVQQSGTQWVQYSGGTGIEESNIINRLDRSINQIQLVLDRKDTILL